MKILPGVNETKNNRIAFQKAQAAKGAVGSITENIAIATAQTHFLEASYFASLKGNPTNIFKKLLNISKIK